MRYGNRMMGGVIGAALLAGLLRAHCGTLFQNWGGPGNDGAASVALDNASNIWVAGSFTGTVDFNPAGPTHSNLTSTGGSLDSFLCKYDQDGTFLWARSWGSTQADRANTVALDAAGNAYVIGCFKGTVDFNPAGDGPGHTNVTANDQDAYLCKYDKDGRFQWMRHWGGDHGEDGYRAAVDPADNSLYAVGDFSSGWVDFNPEPAPGTVHDWHTNRFSAGYGYDAWLCKWSTNGVFQWARTWGGNGYDDCCALAVDGLGHVFTGGFFGSTDNTCDFNTTTNLPHQAKLLNATPPGGPITDAFLSMFDTNGVWQWATSWGSGNCDVAGCLAADKLGNVYVAGYFQTNANNAPVDFNPPGPVHSNLTCRGDGGAGTWGGGDGYLCKYGPTGDFQWAQSWGGTSTDSVTGVAVDEAGYVYVSGVFSSLPCNFSPDPGLTNIFSRGGKDICLSKFDSNGNFLMVKACGGPADDWTYAVAADLSGNAYVCGSFQNTVDFGSFCGGPSTNANGNSDAFLCRLYTGPTAVVYSDATVVANGDMIPAPGKGTDFGNVNLGDAAYTNTLTITNTGYAALALAGIMVAGNALGFSADTGGITNIAIGGSAALRLVFSPWDDTPCSGTVTLADNDTAGGAYSFGISGCGVALGPTQFITAASGAFGSIVPSGTVSVTGGGRKAFTNVPNAYYHVASVVVDGVAQGAPPVYVFTNVTAAHMITNTFAADLSPSNTPNWWLAQYGLTNGGLSFDRAEMNDVDGDLAPPWAEYIAGTDPTDEASVFAVDITADEGQEIVWFPTVVPTAPYGNCSRFYTLETTTNLLNGWTSVVSCVDIPATTGPVVAYTNSQGLTARFYRGRVRLSSD